MQMTAIPTDRIIPLLQMILADAGMARVGAHAKGRDTERFNE